MCAHTHNVCGYVYLLESKESMGKVKESRRLDAVDDEEEEEEGR